MHLIRIVAPQLRNSGSKVHHHVRVRGQSPIDPIQLLGIVAEMNAHKSRMRMAANHPRHRLEDCMESWKFVCVAEPPASMILQLLPALVAFIIGFEKSFWIAD